LYNGDQKGTEADGTKGGGKGPRGSNVDWSGEEVKARVVLSGNEYENREEENQ